MRQGWRVSLPIGLNASLMACLGLILSPPDSSPSPWSGWESKSLLGHPQVI